jgi:uncharacterized membrane protein
VFEISLAQGYSVLTMLAVAVAAIAMAGVFYAQVFKALKPSQWRTLFLLRALAIVLIVLLLFRPVVSYYQTLEEKPGLVFLLDTSASMSIADGATGVTRFNQARSQIESWIEKTRDDFDVALVAFDEQARLLEDREQLAALVPEGKATSLSRALEAAAQQFPGRHVEAAVLLSDGVHNAARDPLEVAGKIALTVHTVGVGASLRSDVSYRDVQVTGLDCPDRLLLGNIARITASIEAVGLAGRVVPVILEEDEQKLLEVELTLDDIEGSQEVVFEFRPQNKGRRTYTVRVPPVGDERIVENNQRSASAMVVEPGIRVLYIEGTLRAEYGALVDRFLSKDPDLEFCALVQTRPNVFLKRTNIEGLELQSIPTDAESIAGFDVFIFGDLDSSYIRPEQQQLFVERVRQGAGLVMLGGYRSLGPGGYAGTPLGEALPVLLGSRDAGQVTEAFLPTLTPEGARHPIFANIAEFFPTQQAEPKTAGLPLLDGCTRIEAARPGATVLATLTPDPESMPVLAAQPLDRGRTAVFCGDTTRKWHQVPRALDQDSPFLQFWGQMVRWLAGRSKAVEREASITGTTDKAYYEPDEVIRFSAVVRDEQGEGAAGAKVVARIRGPAGRPDQVALTTVPGPGGHYAGQFEPRVAGAYEIEIVATVGGRELKTDSIGVEVGRPNLEFEKLDLDDRMLAEIAATRGGRYMHVSVAEHLIDQLNRQQRERRKYVEHELYWPPGFWLLFVATLTTEWALRRKFQLR